MKCVSKETLEANFALSGTMFLPLQSVFIKAGSCLLPACSLLAKEHNVHWVALGRPQPLSVPQVPQQERSGKLGLVHTHKLHLYAQVQIHLNLCKPLCEHI